MKRIATLLPVIALMLILSACGPEPKGPKPVTANAGCGELKTFSVDQSFAAKMEMPEAAFSVSYPDQLGTDPAEEGYHNFNYNYFFKIKSPEDSTNVESIAIGWTTTQKDTPLKSMLMQSLFAQLRQSLQGQGLTLRDVETGKQEFDGQEYYMLRCRGTIDEPDVLLVGDYLVQAMIVLPEVGGENGVLMMMMANDDSEIKSFEDFATKGCISSVWKSFQFNY